MEYRVELPIYNGPLDLLLFLIKRDELNIYDIHISRILESYLAYVQNLKQLTTEQGLDINLAGEFLVMAATLMEIKSAMLLPRPPAPTNADGTPDNTAADLADPRSDLVKQLLEYKRLKDSANLLDRQQKQHEQRFPRFPASREGASDEPPPLDMDEVQIWDLLDAFSRLMKEVGGRPRFHEVTYDDTPIDLHAADIEDRLKRESKLTLRTLLVGRTSRGEMVGVFLALLELIRQKKILVQQQEVTDELEIVEAPEEHKKTYEHASLHLADDSPTSDSTAELATAAAANDAARVRDAESPPEAV